MKTLNFRFTGVKETLSRKQMKQINGGTTCTYQAVLSEGCISDDDGLYNYSCDGSPDYCDAYCDMLCEDDDCCSGVN